jgi:hypothetical protein
MSAKREIEGRVPTLLKIQKIYQVQKSRYKSANISIQK